MPAINNRDFSHFFDKCEAAGFHPALIVDVGVGLGTPGLMSRFPHSRFLLVEPLEEFRQTLSSSTRKYNVTLLNCALGSTEGRGEMSIGLPLETSSLLAVSALNSGVRPIDVRRLDDLKKWDVEVGPILCRISVQGGERDVLDGGRRFLKHADLIVIECSCFRFRGERQPLLQEIVEYMNRAGYTVFSVFNAQYRPYDMAMASVDVAFARREGVLGREVSTE